MTRNDLTLLRAQLAVLWSERTLTNETWLAVERELEAASRAEEI
jgi:hypothetical protein